MNKKYNLKLDLHFRCNNSVMKFNQFDNNTSDFFMRITNSGKLIDIEKALVVLAIIKPSGKVASQFVEIENGLVYADLKPNMRDEIGTYTAKAMLILENERVVTDVISYEVEEDKIFSLLNDTVETSEEFTLLTDMLSRLSTIEISEEQRVINEAERILSEENRKIEEAKRVEAELIRQHEEADRAKYDATRESNENIRKQNESIRLANETSRIDEEAKRVEEENKRKLAEEERNANYNFMTEDEERRRSEANAHKEAEVLRVQAETDRVNEEAKRRTTEQARVSAENTRVSNENTREANEAVRRNNETQRVEAETQRQSRYNSFITDAEANANNFENYTNTAKVKEEERKSNELDRKSQEDRRVSNEVERISNENTRKANEVAREKNETSRQNIFENKVDEVDEKIVELNTTKDNFVSSINTKVDNKISEIEVAKSDMTNTVSNKVNEVETRFNALTSSQQQDAEVIDARTDFKGIVFDSLKERIDYTDKLLRESTVSTVETESDFTTVEATSNGYFEDVKLEGKTIKGEGLITDISIGHCVTTTGESIPSQTKGLTLNYREAKPNTEYTISCSVVEGKSRYCYLEFDAEGNRTLSSAWSTENPTKKITTKSTTTRMVLSIVCDDKSISSQTLQEAIDLYKPLIVEGDRVNNLPILYYGLKSVGDGADEIVVSSSGGKNLFNVDRLVKVGSNKFAFPISYLIEGKTYTISSKKNIWIKIAQKQDASTYIFQNANTTNHTFTVDSNYRGNYIFIMPQINTSGVIDEHFLRQNIQLEESNVQTEFEPCKSDKKRLLYYNNETQAWEKPILRQWDSIEKHADGKYYYHQRSGEVVLNGSEKGWGGTGNSSEDAIEFSCSSVNIGKLNHICDKLQKGSTANSFRSATNGNIVIKLSKSILPTPDTAGVKQWLQANNVTVVYQLAEEKVYECTNIDLLTYANETNYIVESGAIAPKSTLKVHNNISNVVSLLQKKVSLLESNVKASQEVQDMMILETDMRMLDIELALMEFIPMTLNLGGSDMLRSATYFNFLKNHIVNETYEKEYLENVMNKYLATGRINQDEYDELYKMLYPPVYDIELPIEY